MTNEEYNKLYLAARDTFQIEIRKTMAALRDVYRTAAAQVSEIVERAERLGLSEFTAAGNEQIAQQLYASAAEVSRAMENELPLMLNRAYTNSYLEIDESYIMDIVRSVDGASDRITAAGIHNIAVGVNRQLIESMVVRQTADGFTLSERIWTDLIENSFGNMIPGGIFGDFQYRLLNIIDAGIAAGRDSAAIAKDITTYIEGGKVALIKRYGKLVKGTSEFRKRLPGRIDWRVLRLVRSELYAGLQHAGILNGEMNPACPDLYDWIKTAGNPIDQHPDRNASGFRCIDLEEFNPYKRDDVPGHQHSNCSCSVVPVLMDREQFEDDLYRWVQGEQVPYIDDWYNQTYIPGQY
jgi:hypothetical protein